MTTANHPIYLDYNATTPLHPEVSAAMKPYLDDYFGNPSSSHIYGTQSKQAVETARQQLCSLLSCESDEIIFTSGGSESNNYAIKGVVFNHIMGNKELSSRKKVHVVTSSIEHPAVIEVCRYLTEFHNVEVSYVPVDRYGLVNTEDIKKAIRPNETVLITIMHANNEIGSIQPIKEIAQIAHENNILVHTDAAQSIGKIPVNVRDLGVDLLSVCGHKFYGPKGVGALFMRRGVHLHKLIHGANHENNKRAGTENVLLTVGLGKAAELAQKELNDRMKHMKHLRNRLHSGLLSELGQDGVILNGPPDNSSDSSITDLKRLPNTLNVSFPECEANLILGEIEDDVAASAGASCHSGDVTLSPVLVAMNVSKSIGMGTIRFSTGRLLTEEQVDKTVNIVSKIVKAIRPNLNEDEGNNSQECTIEDDNNIDISSIRLTRTTRGLGCGCKLRPQSLEQVIKGITIPHDENVLVGMETSDDSGVYKLRDDLAIVQSVDFFTPVVDNPFDFGAISCTNSLSDIYAMGAKAITGLNIVAFPSRLPLPVLREILRGAQSKADEAGVNVVGGHTIEDTEPKYGMSVTGVVHPEHIWTNSGAQPGDALILTKPIGLGILSTAMKRKLLDEEHSKMITQIMSTLNKYAVDALEGIKVNACTDVTGFGLLGHLKEITTASNVTADVYYKDVPILEQAIKHAVAGIIPGGTQNNHGYVADYVEYDSDMTTLLQMILCDAQTSGGLLVSVPENEKNKAITALKSMDKTKVLSANCIGKISENGDGTIRVHNRSCN